MNLSLLPLAYVGIGVLFFVLIYLFNEDYRFQMKRALLIIKTAGLKSKQAQERMEKQKKGEGSNEESVEQVNLMAGQKTYSQELDQKVDKATEEVANDPKKASRALFGVIIAWPLVVFLMLLAMFVASVYLTDQELLAINQQI